MRSESLQSPEEQQAVLNTMAASGAVYDHKTVGIPMPNLITIDEPVELQSGQPVYFQCRRGDYCPFFFRIEKPCVIKLNTWPLDEQSDPDLYVGIDSDRVDENVHMFKSNQIGADRILVYPDDPKFRCGVWRVSIHAFNNGEEQKLGVKLTIKEAKPITCLPKNMLEPIRATVADSAFFKYEI